MHEDWTSSLNAITAEITALCGNLDHTALNWKPNAETWSVAQVLDHLIKVNTSYFPVIAAVRANTYHLSWMARIPYLPRLMGRMILNSVKPTNKRKVRTFQKWEPVLSTLDASIMDDFVRSQAEVATLMTSCSDLLHKRTLISSPVNRHIVYSLEDAFHIIIQHEMRHTEQIKRILALQGKNS